MLGREATALQTDLNYVAIRRALETGDRLARTVEFFPEQGKYHLDGHRKCGVRFLPEQTRACGGNCPECRKPLTVGVLHWWWNLPTPAAASRDRACADLRGAGAEVLMPLARRCGDDLGRFFTEIARGTEADAADPRATSLALMALVRYSTVSTSGAVTG
jgi:DNA helicase II / ATP-dependent DNA helicase PcrA